MAKTVKLAGFLFLIIVPIISFLVFAPVFSKTLSSDNAIHVLMTESLSFPQDFYFWGQSRLGSLVPILAHLLYILLPIKSITAISIVQYTLLVFAFYFLQKHLNGIFSKILLCLIIFIPFPLMLPQVSIAHPYTPQFFLFSLVLFLQKTMDENTEAGHRKKTFYFLLISLVLIFSVWISEVSLFFILTFFLRRLFSSFNIINNGGGKITLKSEINVFPTITFSFIFILISICVLKFLVYVKSTCYNQPGIDVWFTDLKVGLNKIDDFWISFRDSFEFKGINVFISTHNLIFLILLLSVFTHSLYKLFRYKVVPSGWFVFFLFNAIISFFFLMFSNWVALNEYELRYFIYPYLFISFALVFYLDSISGKLKLILQLTYVSAILSFCVTTFQFQCINYKHDPRNFSLERVKQLKQLENGGLIGDYWYSYALALNSEMNIKATAHEYDYIRNSVMADSVLLRKNIFVVANQWLNSFPDTLTQFGLNLIRNGEPQKINEIDFCNYRLSSFPLVYYPKSPEQLKGNLTTFLKEKTLIPFTTDSNKVYYSEWFVYGPYSKIPPGKYKIRFQLHFTPGFKQNGSITFDASENSGEIIHSSKTVVFNEDLLPSADEYVLDFSIEKMINMGEYRIKLNGIFSFEFKSIIVEKVR